MKMTTGKTFQFMFKKGSEWRGYHSEYGFILPDPSLLTVLRRTVFTNIALIDATRYTKPVDQEYYEVSGSTIKCTLPEWQEVYDVLYRYDSMDIRDGVIVLYEYGPFCVSICHDMEKIMFYTHMEDDIMPIRYKYNEDMDEAFSDFLPSLIENASEFDISQMEFPVKSTRYIVTSE